MKYFLQKIYFGLMVGSIFIFFGFLFDIKKSEALTLTPIRLEVQGDPGSTITKKVTLINENTSVQNYYVSYANFEAQGDSGTPNFVNPTDGIGTWITTEKTISLKPKTQLSVPVTIKIPKDATPGGYFGVVFWGTTPPDMSGSSVSIGARVGVLVLLSVNGDVKVSGGINDFNTLDGKNFYESLPINFVYYFHNAGGDRIKPSGNISLKNIFGSTVVIPANKIDGNILPNQTRKFTATWGEDKGDTDIGFFAQVVKEYKNFAFGKYTGALSLSYGPNNIEHVNSPISLWVVPWQLFLIIILTLVFLFIFIKFSLKHYNNWLILKAEKMFEEKEEKMEGHHHNEEEHHRNRV